ncbi:MAG: DUF1460 domain-containing protein [Bacteroidales bacterium]|jgi:hypothetical protein|nr:DUF1460 domain-containing protein [Bacteroidales bacterium]
MKIHFLLLLLLPIVFACNTATKKILDDQKNKSKTIHTPQDVEIFKAFITLFQDQKDAPVADIVIKAGIYLLNTPYAEHTLERDTEQLVINLREMDCTTFVENSFALARTLKSEKHEFEQFVKELTNMRYRYGRVNDYTYRLHYFSDWMFVNTQNNLLKDVTKDIAGTPLIKEINFMSTHPHNYKQLTDGTLVPVIAEQEKEISTREMYFIPKNKLTEVEDKLMNGDIIAITTSIEGLDVSHTALLIRINDAIHILHASSAKGKVVISDETLHDYLMQNKQATGIMVARPLTIQ